MRNRAESSQVARESFEPERIAVTQRVIGCYCVSVRASDSGVFENNRSLPNEKRRKAEQNEHTLREGHAVQARPVKTFRSVGDITKKKPLTCE